MEKEFLREFSEFAQWWSNDPMSMKGRNNLDGTDKAWDYLYNYLVDNKEDNYIFSDDLLFRVHSGGQQEPKYSDDDDHENQDEIFEHEHKFWLKQNDIKAIDFNNHWVSFSDSIDSINSDYFAEKGLRGFVIVIKPKKAIRIHNIVRRALDEREVVAPMDETTLVEILPFKDFLVKYKEN